MGHQTSERPDGADADRLGGRLALLAPDTLTGEQRQVYDALCELAVPEAEQGGFTARLPDGRLIGPFNALLRDPRLTSGFGQWVRAIGAGGLPANVRETIILTVGAEWGADYEIYAHRAAGAAAGLPQDAIDAILTGAAPDGLTPVAQLAYRLAHALVVDHTVPEALYAEACAEFGEAGLLTVLGLIAQYQLISSVLVCFDVPVPLRDAVQDVSHGG
jgi:4-carboxymuconolactone decarboxylase